MIDKERRLFFVAKHDSRKQTKGVMFKCHGFIMSAVDQVRATAGAVDVMSFLSSTIRRLSRQHRTYHSTISTVGNCQLLLLAI